MIDPRRDPGRDPASSRPFTLVLRLLPQHGASGRIVGHAEVVTSGERVPLSDVDDLLALIRRLSGGNDDAREVSTMAIGEIHWYL